MRGRVFASIGAAVLFGCAIGAAGALPPGFATAPFVSDWNFALGLTFAADGRMFVWEKGGKVWIVDNGVKAATPLIDIGEEVADWGDHGLMGCALDPDFQNNGYIYLLYVVDRHHMFYFGTPQYNPNANEYNLPSIGRVARHTCDSNTNFTTVIPGSRLVLLGNATVTGVPPTLSAHDGIPVVRDSHGLGSLVFGEDGTLFASCGDTAGYGPVDNGGPPVGGQAALARINGIITEAEDVGAFRSQLVDTQSAKIMRIDRATGDGVPSNPFFDPLFPQAPRSRLWALGVRNPFRCSLRPGSGSVDPTAGDPGSLYVGDVGYNSYEELNILTRGGLNCGWPTFEGLYAQPDYTAATTYNMQAPNPLFGMGGCTEEFFPFQALLVQDTLATPSWPNPCDAGQQITNVPTFEHHRAALEWSHFGLEGARVPIYNGNNASACVIGTMGCPTAGVSFVGHSITGGIWYTGTDFPPEYQNTYFVGDFTFRWIKNLVMNIDEDTGEETVAEVREFLPPPDAGFVVAMATSPVDGGLYYIAYDTEGASVVFRVQYGGNLAPVAAASASPQYGPLPLTVQFSSAGSVDFGGENLTYEWDFGDGNSSTDPNPEHTYEGPGERGSGPTRYDVTLTVRDEISQPGVATTFVTTNNTPPSATITHPPSGSLISSGGGDLTVPLTAIVSDAEDPLGALTCRWQMIVHHNVHTHQDPPQFTCSPTETVLRPHGTPGDDLYFEIRLTITDSLGLSTVVSSDVFEFFPTCDGDADFDGDVDFNDVLTALANWGGEYLGGLTGPGNADGDTNVDFDDVLTVFANWGNVCPPAPFEGSEVHTVNSACPISGAHFEDAPATTTFEGETVGFCCPYCKPAWDAMTDEQRRQALRAVEHSENP